jgi:uncharacterized protein (DUF433 family)
VSNIDSIVGAFTEEQVERLTGLTKAQLRYWDRTGFFAPQYGAENRRSPYSRIYSFKDVVGLRTLGVLRNEHHVPLQHLRKVAEKLCHLASDLWTRTILWVLDKKVIVQEPGTGRPQEAVTGQYVLDIPLKVIVSDMKRNAETLRQREPTQIGRIEKRRHVVRNAAVVAGTRIPIATILRFVEDGHSPAAIVKEYPTLTEADIEAVISHDRAGRAA